MIGELDMLITVIPKLAEWSANNCAWGHSQLEDSDSHWFVEPRTIIINIIIIIIITIIIIFI